jgi:transcription elongation factor Elf1
MSIESDLFGAEDTFPCPRCGFQVWFRMVDAVAQVTLTCTACRTRIRLVDDRASVRTAIRQMDSAIEDLNRTLKGLFG